MTRREVPDGTADAAVAFDRDVFVSYASVDRPRAGAVRDALVTAGLSVWMDDREIDTFDGITAALEAGLASSRSMLVCLTRDYLDRPTCQWELCEALARTEEDERESRIFLVVLDDVELVDLPMALIDLRRLVLSPRGGPETTDALVAEAIPRIRARLGRTEGTFGPALRPVVGRWWPRPPAASDTFTGRFLELIHLRGLLVGDPQLVLSRVVGSRRPVCLVGMGGIGKTLLAEEYGRRFGRSHPGGIIRISAYGDRIRRTGSPDEAEVLLIGLIAGQLRNLLSHLYRAPTTAADELPPLATLSELSTLRAALHDVFATAGRPLLWIVDDVPDGLGIDMVQTLLCPHPELGANLLTSRSDTYRAVMETVELDSLDPDHSVALLARHRVPRTAEDQRHARAVAAALGGHPLALDVTGARLARGTLSYDQLSSRLRDGEAVGAYEEIAAALRDDLPTGHATSIVMTLSDSLDALPVASRRTVDLASVLAPGEPVPFPLAAVLMPKDRSRAGSRGPDPVDLEDWNIPMHAVRSVQDATDEVVGARLVRVDATSYATHILVSGVARELLRRRSGLGRPSREATTRALAWKASLPMVMHNPYSPQSARVGLQSVRHLLHLTDLGLAHWARTSWPRRRDLVDLRMWLADILDRMGFEVPARAAVNETVTRVVGLLGPGQPDLEYGWELLRLVEFSHDTSTRVFVVTRLLRLSDRLNGPLSDDSLDLLGRLAAYLAGLKGQDRDETVIDVTRREWARRLRCAINEATAARVSIGLMTTYSAVLKDLGRESERAAVGIEMQELLDAWIAAVPNTEGGAESGYQAYSALLALRRSEGRSLHADEWATFLDINERYVDEMLHRTAADSGIGRALVHRLQLHTAGADRRGDLPRLEAKYRNVLHPTPAPTWAAGSRLTSWGDVRGEVDYLRSLPVDSDGARISDRLHVMVDDVLGEVRPDRGEYLSRVRHLFLTLRDAAASWNSLPDTHPLTVELAALQRRFEDEARRIRGMDAARSGLTQGEYLALLAWIGDMLQGLAIGDEDDVIQTFLRLAQELERTHGRLAPLTLQAWENAAENSDRRGDPADPNCWQRGIAIRGMVADRYLQILEHVQRSTGAASAEAFAALEKATEYLRLSERAHEISLVGQAFYETVCREAGPRSAEARWARHLLANGPDRSTATRVRELEHRREQDGGTG
jgi:hypothetical protein